MDEQAKTMQEIEKEVEKVFQKVGVQEHTEEWDDRQRRIEGWDAQAIRRSKVFVAGAGAIGNETIKNMALLGFPYGFICDLDKIENTNLTRTVLFGRDDIGQLKAPLAARRFQEMNLAPHAAADSFAGDMVYELGDGVFRRCSLILGCLDNTETRMYLNKIAMRYDIPYVDAGIQGLNWTVKVYGGHKYGCYECFAPAYKYEDRFRQSCNVTMKKAAEAGKVATVQNISAAASAFQVTEALKIVCDMKPKFGMEYYFNADTNSFTSFSAAIDENCPSHMEDVRTEVRETPLSCENTVREFLEYTGRDGFTRLSTLEDKNRAFIPRVKCPHCGAVKEIGQPLYKVYHDDFYCDRCKAQGKTGQNYDNFMSEISVCAFTLAQTPAEILDRTLKEIGVPAFHVLPVYREDTDEAAYYELTGDMEKVMPKYNFPSPGSAS